jgi:hypothetical protein
LFHNEAVKRCGHVALIPIVLVAFPAWFALFNHCALNAAFLSAPAQTRNECPLHAKPTAPPQKDAPGQLPCCKILRVLVATPARIPEVSVVAVDFVFTEPPLVAPPKISFHLPTLGTGPPGRCSFAELILQRSLFAHAPPRFA